MATKTAKTSNAEVVIQEVSLPFHRKIFSGNVMYINPETRSGSAYVTLMVRFMDNCQVEDTPVGIFVEPEQLGLLKVGDLAAFAAARIVVGKTALPDGTPIYNASGFDKGFGVQVVREKAEEVELVAIGEVQSEGLRDRITSLSSGLKGFLGL